MRDLTELDAKEIRVLGALMEKEQATPEYYPLTLKALTAACNQKTNRDPVFSMAEIDVLNTLRVLQQEQLVERVTGARVDRWEHRVDPRLHFKPPLKAVLTLLLLRGPQTPGELRARSDRLHAFSDIHAVEEALHDLAQQDPPLAKPLARQPGQKETRWSLAAAGDLPEPDFEISTAPPATASTTHETLDRLARLEADVEELQRQLRSLQDKLGEI